MADLLLELFSEEIPARMQKDAPGKLAFSLNAYGVGEFGEVTCYVTPRRVAIWIKGLQAIQPDITTELKGPKVSAPESALQGFLKKNGLQPSDLVKRDDVYFATLHQKGKPTAELIKLAIEKTLMEFPWPKSMRWGAGDVTWVRPLHSILCIFDGNIVPVQFGGITAGNVTYGHRFLSPQAIAITDPREYESALEKAFVIADRDKRKAEILKQAQAAAKGLAIKKDDGLLEEVTGLVEYPVVLTGSIDAKFMDLPPEVLTTVMRSHQKYFALEDAGGKLSAHFLITANMKTSDGGKAIVAGNERVLRARFSDARFFWDMDRKKPLDDWAKGLGSVTFHAKLGTVADKVERIKALAAMLAEYVPGADKKQVERAAALCKADLVTGMVGEFAELQGIMGRYYALQQNEAPAVADAIRDHYKPQGPNDSVPANPVSICIALADKLDTLVSMFAIDENPSGSKDPFALRRATLGIIRIILENRLRIPLIQSFQQNIREIIPIIFKSIKVERISELKIAREILPQFTSINQMIEKIDAADSRVLLTGNGAKELVKELYKFFIDRLKVQLKDQGIRHDVINAVVANGDDDLLRIVARARALQDFLATDDGSNLLTAYKRAANILAIEEKKDKTTYAVGDLDQNILQESSETGLAALLDAQSQLMGPLRQGERFAEAMKTLAALRAPVDLFFDNIMVNCDDKDLRANRLRLLAGIRGSMDNIANFALIEG